MKLKELLYNTKKYNELVCGEIKNLMNKNKYLNK